MNKEIILEDLLGLSDKPGSKRNFWQLSFESGQDPSLIERRYGGCRQEQKPIRQRIKSAESTKLIDGLTSLDSNSRQALADVLTSIVDVLKED